MYFQNVAREWAFGNYIPVLILDLLSLGRFHLIFHLHAISSKLSVSLNMTSPVNIVNLLHVATPWSVCYCIYVIRNVFYFFFFWINILWLIIFNSIWIVKFYLTHTCFQSTSHEKMLHVVSEYCRGGSLQQCWLPDFPECSHCHTKVSDTTKQGTIQQSPKQELLCSFKESIHIYSNMFFVFLDCRDC